MFNKKSITDIDVHGKHVLVRVDFNVPIKAGVVKDDTRIRAALPTIEYLLAHGAAVILFSHLGRPKDAPEPEFSMAPVAKYLTGLVNVPVHFVDDCIGPKAEAASKALKPGEILVLENTRFYKAESKNDLDMAKKFAALADIYVNDAFGSAHRAHASTEGVARFLPAVAGFLMEKEIKYLGQAIANPNRPFVAILGGAKISDKIGVIDNLLDKADAVLIGGGMANTFLKAKGLSMGDSLVEDEVLGTAKTLLEKGGDKLHLPIDLVIANAFENEAQRKVVPVGPIEDGWRILDIGPETVKNYSDVIQKAGTIVWNGPMGVFEMANFAEGTYGVARAVADSKAVSIIGGGDSVAAINQSGLSDKVTHISTGGGASLEMLEGKVLPGLAALLDR
ncbi:MAG: phosphoglycerate kinase [Chloroflexi bacterium HGW-Chloroflexi-8]|nr:MAG: phosphoglycerate kinase [Chloroflexi bacterium HGW-Chloroflexi-8]